VRNEEGVLGTGVLAKEQCLFTHHMLPIVCGVWQYRGGRNRILRNGVGNEEGVSRTGVLAKEQY